MAVKIDRNALMKAREEGAIPSRPANSFGPYGTTNPDYPLMRLTAYKGQKVLLYIPDMKSTTIVDEEGIPTVDMDNYSLHQIEDGSQYGKQVRCVRGITLPEFGLDGNCPLCDLSTKYTEFIKGTILPASAEYQNVLAEHGGDESAKEVTKKRGQIYSKFKKVGFGSERYTVPVALVETKSVKRGAVTVQEPVMDTVDGVGKPRINFMYMDLSGNQYEKLKKSYEGGFDDSDMHLPEDAGALYNSWVLITVPDKDDNMEVGKEVLFSRYAPAERKNGQDAKLWEKMELAINKRMDEKQFDSITAMEVLTRNRIESRDEIDNRIAPLAVALEELKAQFHGKSSMREVENASTENALDRLLAETGLGTAQAEVEAGAGASQPAEQATTEDDDIF